MAKAEFGSASALVWQWVLAALTPVLVLGWGLRRVLPTAVQLRRGFQIFLHHLPPVQPHRDPFVHAEIQLHILRPGNVQLSVQKGNR